MAKDTETSPEVCPVDPATRAAWLKSNGGSRPEAFPGVTKEASEASKGNSCDSSMIDQTPPTSKGFFSRFTTPVAQSQEAPKSLGVDREISTIPRASPISIDGAKPANSEKESGVSENGNWIYPSEKMFFDAMKRKGYSSDAKDMKTIVPIHNAVNERAWKEIKEWERPWGSEQKYTFPFAGRRSKLTLCIDVAAQNYIPSLAYHRLSARKHESIPGWDIQRLLIGTTGSSIDVVRRLNM
jgi:cytochrome c heme-lyase